MKNLIAATLLLVSFAMSAPATDSTAVNCQKIQNSAVGNLLVGGPAFVSTVIFIPVPVVSFVILGFYMAAATKISKEYSEQGCGTGTVPKVVTR